MFSRNAFEIRKIYSVFLLYIHACSHKIRVCGYKIFIAKTNYLQRDGSYFNDLLLMICSIVFSVIAKTKINHIKTTQKSKSNNFIY